MGRGSAGRPARPARKSGARVRALAAVAAASVAWSVNREQGAGALARCDRPRATGQPERVDCSAQSELGPQALPLGTARVLGLAVDLNALSEQDLASLTGVGENLARRIVAAGKSRGGFRSIDDLADVKGVGPAKLATLRGALEPPSR